VSPGKIIEAWQTGMDVMLIPIDLLKEMKEEAPELPFCCIGNNINDEIPFIGEDNFFVHRLHKRGTKLLVNTDVQCLHMDLATGMYTAHPSVDLTKYYTNIKPTRPLTLDDKEFIDRRWIDRLPEGTSYKSVIENKINKKEPIRFNMGSGNDKLEGYLAVDKNSEKADIKVDVLKMDLPENITDEILASHLIEHLPQHRAPELLSKWYKTLKPKGKLVVETPNIEELCKDFLNQSDEERRMTLTCIFGAAAEEDTAETREKGALYPHLWGYTPKTLTDLCKSIGFKEVKILPQSGKHPGKNFRLEAVK
jgi:SAM-dependent methyltransferase